MSGALRPVDIMWQFDLDRTLDLWYLLQVASLWDMSNRTQNINGKKTMMARAGQLWCKRRVSYWNLDNVVLTSEAAGCVDRRGCCSISSRWARCDSAEGHRQGRVGWAGSRWTECRWSTKWSLSLRLISPRLRRSMSWCTASIWNAKRSLASAAAV